MSYLLITVAGISHKDLLLNSDIALPILQVKIELTRFFLFAPILLVLLHLGLMGQLVLLARKTLEFAAAIRMLETTDQRTHPLRLELDNFFFVQAIAGPERSRIVGIFLHGMSWLTLVVMPVVLLLYVQLVFLPYHDVAITWVHRLMLLADIALLVFIGVFLWRLETSFFRAFLAHEPASSRRPAAAPPLLLAGVGRLLALRRHHPRRGHRSAGRAAGRRQAGDGGRSSATPCRPSASRRGLAARPLSPQPQRHRHGPGGRQGRDAGRAVAQSARPRSALRPARPHRSAPGRPDGRQPRRREPRRRRPARRLDGLRRPQRAAAHRQPPAPPDAPARAAPTSPRRGSRRPRWPASTCARRRLEEAQLEGAQLGTRPDDRRQLRQRPSGPRRLSAAPGCRGPTSCWPRCRAPISPAPSCRWPTSPAPPCRAPACRSPISRAPVLRDAELEGASLQMARLHGADMRAPSCRAAT